MPRTRTAQEIAWGPYRQHCTQPPAPESDYLVLFNPHRASLTSVLSIDPSMAFQDVSGGRRRSASGAQICFPTEDSPRASANRGTSCSDGIHRGFPHCRSDHARLSVPRSCLRLGVPLFGPLIRHWQQDWRRARWNLPVTTSARPQFACVTSQTLRPRGF